MAGCGYPERPSGASFVAMFPVLLIALLALAIEPAPAPPSGHSVEQSNELLDFAYQWPAEAAALPALDARLRAELDQARAKATAQAREDRAERGADIPFHGHYFSKSWETVGDGDRLLALAGTEESFTGGAHGNQRFDGLIWDREASRAIAPADLFIQPAAAFAALQPRYCALLDAERAERRSEPLPLEGEGWMVDCPPIAEQVLLPRGGDRRGFLILLPPYAAGPYAEGSYVVEIAAEPELVRLVRPEYRGLLQPQRQ